MHWHERCVDKCFDKATVVKYAQMRFRQEDLLPVLKRGRTVMVGLAGGSIMATT